MGRTVLVVDDHAGFRQQARLLLEEAGYDVIGEAADAASAVALARRLCPDLVLLDVQLPDGDGFSVAATLALGDVPPTVVLVSGREQADFADQISSSPARAFIAKIDLSPDTLHTAFATPGLA